jgi:hypothetical protein
VTEPAREELLALLASLLATSSVMDAPIGHPLFLLLRWFFVIFLFLRR